MKHNKLFELAVLTANTLRLRSRTSIPISYKKSVKDVYAVLLELDKELQADNQQASDDDLSTMMKDPIRS